MWKNPLNSKRAKMKIICTGMDLAPFQVFGQPPQFTGNAAAWKATGLHLGDHLSQAAMECFSGLGIGPARGGPRNHSRAAAPSDLQPSFRLQRAIRLRHGVEVDAEIERQARRAAS